ncbi:MAG TPA: peptide deformylase [Candidatus Moranbacteria bacterium]|jgi:peptide deformylase|nr:peptide deformylase [Candidatus Moranbacteria bacterium]HQB59228.1 peptide deformylase [Candidatus Moranbacteria bacterium]
MKLKIRKNPDPILRQKAAKIKFPLDKKTQELVLVMSEMLISNKNAIGLAAPQVGESLRLCVINLDGELYVAINPKITAKSRKKIVSEEGCLSFPNEFYPVSRCEDVQVRFSDPDGKPRKVRARGLLARAFQHEIDHLDGILFIDKITKSKTISKSTN